MRHLQAAAAVNCIGHHDIGQLAAPPQGKQPGHFAKLAGGKVGEVNKNQPGIIQMANGGRKEMVFSGHCPIIPPLFARPTAVQVTAVQGVARPANGCGVETAVWQA